MLKIKELREEKAISQLKLAQIIGTSQRNISRWENGSNEPAYSYLIKIADFFDVTLDYLTDREDSDVQPSATNRSTDQLTAKEKRLLKAFTSLPELEKNKLIEDAEFYALRHVKQEQH